MLQPRENSAKTRTTVPVASRTKDQALDRRAPRGGVRGKAVGVKPKRDKLDVAGWGVLAVVTIFFLLAVSVPLGNFYEGRAEIARLNDSIDVKLAEKERLLEDIEKFRSDSYIEQQARRRLGLVAQGETAYRILDPKMHHDPAVTTDKQAQEDSREWYNVLWDSVAEPIEEVPELAPADPVVVPEGEAHGEAPGDAPAEPPLPVEGEAPPADVPPAQ
ncbi:hypothetical protein CPHO_08170 [Corynebacterium phocae]|uniref:Septum formation initiator n=1 Tax=Corynebacterium phocae TaxID=161895 RepID=A0A1L7D407_9CORY|nr:septum formation initiator family protein [Corynebacterium phocae]APT92864.1 hypothetical protein CPHO_08170 [Corynebacterium phocae]KAA8723184.1 septum formation initiator family protein [Corynebacterium phocae]